MVISAQFYVLHMNIKMNKNKVSESQKAAQKKYDEKTKSISIKYTPADMEDFNRMDEYIKRTGQSTNGFIKKLIKEFFDWSTDERDRKEHYKSYLSEDDLDNLKRILDNDEKKYKIILDLYADNIEDALTTALEEMSDDFEEWVDNLEGDIADGNINMESERQFVRDIDKSMGGYINSICY